MSDVDTILTYKRESRNLQGTITVTSADTDDKGYSLCVIRGETQPRPGTGAFTAVPSTLLSFAVHAGAEKRATIQQVGPALKAMGLSVTSIMDGLLLF